MQGGALGRPRRGILFAADGKKAPVGGVLGAPDHLVLKTIGAFIRDSEERFGHARDGGRVEFPVRCQQVDDTPRAKACHLEHLGIDQCFENDLLLFGSSTQCVEGFERYSFPFPFVRPT